MKRFYSNGKLLLTGEYVVLDGAVALAVPTLFGQSLDVKKGDRNALQWTSIDENGNTWFETEYDLQHNEILKQVQNDDPISIRLFQILKATKQLNPEFLNGSEGYSVTTALEFPKNWGLGTSSTLINNIAKWAEVDAYTLLELTFGGSGYDIACAEANRSLTYQLKTQNNEIPNQVKDDNVRVITSVDFDPNFKDDLYFVHLNQKQNSREGIVQYRASTFNKSSSISRISEITEAMVSCHSFNLFQDLIAEHELLISEIIKQTPVKERLFSDFDGSIKSLGAWGGDFVMAATKKNPNAYFKSKGYHTIIPYSEMIKN